MEDKKWLNKLLETKEKSCVNCQNKYICKIYSKINKILSEHFGILAQREIFITIAENCKYYHRLGGEENE